LAYTRGLRKNAGVVVENAYIVVLADRCLGQELRELPDLLLVEAVRLSFLPVFLGLPE
jgi:hypothetical protein